MVILKRLSWRMIMRLLLQTTVMSAFLLSASVKAQMQALDDDQMARVAAQGSLFLAGFENGTGISSDLGFYRMGLDAKVEINFNLKKLQLGCAGINGNGCDLDINDLSFSGQNCSGPRAACLGSLTRPFIEFAIKDNSSPTLRHVVGFRFSAENMTALLSAGQNTSSPNGIERLSGYLPVAATSGTAQTIGRDTAGASISQYRFGDRYISPGVNSGNAEQVVTQADINVLACTTGCGNGRWLRTDTAASGAGIDLPSVSAPFNVPAFVIQGSRLSSATVYANATLPAVPIRAADGKLHAVLDDQACVLFLVCLKETDIRLNADIIGLKANITFTEDLGFIHNIPVDSPFSLSLQDRDVVWPGSKDGHAAQRGWWLALSDAVDLGTINPADKVDISSAFPQLASIIGTQLGLPANRITVTTGDGIQALVGGEITKSIGNLDLSSATALTLNLSNLKLDGAQNVTPNCYGSFNFC